MNKTAKVIVRKGTEEVTITVNNGATVADLAKDSMLRTVFDLGDNVQIIRNGVELSADAPISANDEVEVVKKANKKG